MMDFHSVFPEINLNPVRVTCPEELDRSMALKNTLLKFPEKRQLARRPAQFHGEGRVFAQCITIRDLPRITGSDNRSSWEKALFRPAPAAAIILNRST
jgi:hypothetical protein